MSVITVTERLSLATLAATSERQGVAGPAMDPRALSTGIVHFGVGAFHRAHQAVYTEDAAAAAGDPRWGILGVTGRSARVAEQLGPQDGLYSVLTKARDCGVAAAVMGSLRKVVFPGVDSAGSTEDAGFGGRSSGVPDHHGKRLPADAPGRAGYSPTRGWRRTLKPSKTELAGRPFAGPARTPLGLLARGLARRYASLRGPVRCDVLRQLDIQRQSHREPGAWPWPEAAGAERHAGMAARLRHVPFHHGGPDRSCDDGSEPAGGRTDAGRPGRGPGGCGTVRPMGHRR